MGVVAANQYEVTNRLDKCNIVRISLKKRAKCCKSDILHIIVVSTGQFFQLDKYISKSVYAETVRNSGKVFI